MWVITTKFEKRSTVNVKRNNAKNRLALLLPLSCLNKFMENKKPNTIDIDMIISQGVINRLLVSIMKFFSKLDRPSHMAIFGDFF